MLINMENRYADKERFLKACSDVCGKERVREGIGTLSERTLHAVIKRFIEPDESFHEVKVGSNIADVKNSDGIFEVQTRAFNKLRSKLNCFLQESIVTIVYPIPAEKYLLWLEPKTGELSIPRKSPKKGRIYDAVAELYKLDRFITHENLRILLLFVDIDEYRSLRGNSNAGKKHSVRYERIPKKLSNALLLTDNNDYTDNFLPRELPAQFTSKDLAAYARIPLKLAQTTLTVLTKRSAISYIGKNGRLKLYEIDN